MRFARALARLIVWLGAGAFLATGAAVAVILVYLVPALPATEVLKDVRFQVPLRVYTRDERLLAEFGEKRRVPLEMSAVPPRMVRALLASEDEHFYEHPGVDWRGLARAVVYLVRTGQKGPGGSTITMQVARNFFLSREKTYLRKLNEILLALKIERELSKDEILELYVNKIFLGHRAYGVGAAAEVYYGKSVAELTLPQMAMIAGLPQRPSDYNPIVSPKRARERRDYVLRRMLAAGHIEREAFESAVATPITARLHRPVVEVQAPYLAEMVRAYMEERAGEDAYTEGYRVFTTVGSRLQDAATRAVNESLMEYDVRHGYRGPELRIELSEGTGSERLETLLKDIPIIGGLRPGVVLDVQEEDAKIFLGGHGEIVIPLDGMRWARRYVDENRIGAKVEKAADVVAPGDVVRVALDEDGWKLTQAPKVEGALVALDPGDGRLLAVSGGFDFFRSKFNRALQAERQPGSSFKPFIYSAALEYGFTAATLINDAPVVFDDPGLEAAWRPENYSGKFFGPTRLRWALTHSRNLVSIRLLREIGVASGTEYIGRFGFDPARLPKNLSLALGSGTVTPLELATGYSVLANGGFAVQPHFVDRILDTNGNELYRADPLVACVECEQRNGVAVGALVPPAEAARRTAPRVVSAENVYIMGSMLRDVVRLGTGRGALELGRSDLAGKTGTTNDQRDAWFSGFVPSVVATAWVGFDQLEPLGRRETGGRAALPIWKKFMRIALEGVPETVPERPDGIVAVRIDPETGLLADASLPGAVFEIFRSDTVPGGARTTSGTAAAANGSAAGDTRLGPAGVPTGLPAPGKEQAAGATERLF